MNLTVRPGYDNQPQLTPDGAALLFTSVREDGRADTWRYDLEAGAARDADGPLGGGNQKGGSPWAGAPARRVGSAPSRLVYAANGEDLLC